jgi:hypothetical protein
MGLAGTPLGVVVAVAGAITALTGFVGFCPMCAMVGRQSAPVARKKEDRESQ